MKVYSYTPMSPEGTPVGETHFTSDENLALNKFTSGYEVKVADAFFHPVAVSLSRVRTKGESEAKE